MNTTKFLILGTLVAGMFLTMTQPASAAVYDIRGVVGLTPIPTAEGTAMVEEFTTEGSTGTGTFKPFLQVNQLGGHPKSPVYGYSTNLAVPNFPVAFYTTEPTYAPRTDELPVVEVGGILYIEFVCDNNQNNNAAGRQLSFDQLKVYQTEIANINYAQLSALTPIWDLDSAGDSWIHLNAQFGHGSGSGDMRILIPYSLFNPATTYVAVWVSFGGNPGADPSDDAQGVESAHPNNDGFEEFGYLLKPGIPDVSITKTADTEAFCLDQAPYEVLYTYEVQNTGTDDLTDVVVTDDTCSSPTYVSGDDGDGLLNPLEIWIYECTAYLEGATTNTGTVVAVGVESETEVTDSDTAFVDVVEVAVTIEPAAAEICEGDDPVELCAVASLGSGDYSYLWSTAETSECINVSTAGVYWVVVHDNETGCEDYAEAELSVISVPTCSILGLDEVCADDVEILYESEHTADRYYWEISGDGVINGANNGPTVLVDATGVGGFTLTLEVCNDGDVIECCDSCFIEVITWPCEPGIQIIKYPSIDSFCLDDVPVPVTYTYEVSTTGDEDLVNVYVEDDKCGPLVRGADAPGNNDDILEIGEVWVYTCSTSISETTENFVFVEAEGIFSHEPVYDDDIAMVTGYDVAVEVTPAESEICVGGDPVELTANVTLGSGNYSYLWDTGETTQSIFVDEAGEYCVTVTDIDTGCVAEACAYLYVVDTPECSIEGPRTLCVGNQVEFCATVSDADTYEWVITAGTDYAEIVGDNTGNCVDVLATGEGMFTLELMICNEGDVVVCCDLCSTDVLVEPCGGAYCSFTQGFWGNEGGMGCDPGVSTTELLIALLDAPDASTAGADPVIVGQLGVRSITFDTANCILLRLPAGGPPKALPDFGDKNCDDAFAPNLLFKDGRFRNVLVGQVVALTLNLRLNPGCLADGADLGSYILPDSPTCTVPYDNEEACVEQFEIPEALQGMSVDQLLDAANAALAGDTTYSMSDIYKAVTAINEAFDECRIIVPCIRPEICDNGCDDDGDGDVDCDDLDCSGVGDCPVIETVS